MIPTRLLENGLFPRQIAVGLPDRTEREEILKIKAKGLHLANDVNLALIARTTCGLTGAALANIITQASQAATRRNEAQVHMADFEEALDGFLLGPGRTNLISEAELQVSAVHEAGHALIAWLTPQAEPIRKISVLPMRQPSRIYSVRTSNAPDLTRDNIMARLAVLLGGRAAEELTFGEATTRSEHDLIEATALARQMVTSWGMSNLGLAAFNNQTCSEETAQFIDREVQCLLDERYRFAKERLGKAWEKFEPLMQTLLAEETIRREKIIQILGKRSFDDQVLPVRELEIPRPHHA